MTERDIFLALLDLPDPEARAARLQQACGGDPALRARVEALVRSHDRAGSFLASPAVAPPEPDAAATRDLGGESVPDGPARGGEALAFLTSSTRPDSLGRIGHYEVLEVLGRGGFGIVLRAFDEVLQRVVAVKVLAPQMAATSPARKRFLREARSSAKVRHENVVQVYEVGEQPLPYLVMEFIPGETLQQRLDRTGPVEVLEVVQIGRQVAEGLAAAHAQGLIHRDIKPGNVLIEAGPQQRVKITDFGLARAADDANVSQSGVLAGTPMFMAPEQAKGESLDQRADLFSLGSVLYQMVTGRPPFRANSTVGVLKRVAEHTPRPIREIIPETPQWLCDIIARLHVKNPDERFQSARDVANILAECEARLKANARTADFPRLPGKTTGAPGRWKWAAAAAVLLLLVALGTYALVRPGTQPEAAGTGSNAPPIPPKAGSPATWHGWPLDPPAPAIAPFDANQARAHQEAWAKYLGVPAVHTNTLGMKFALVPPGEFLMGGTPSEVEAALKDVGDNKAWQDIVKSQAPQHKVILTRPSYLGIHEVTQAAYEKVMGTNPSTFAPAGTNKDRVGGLDTSNHPVEMVSWYDAAEFCAKLSRHEHLKPQYFRAGDTVRLLEGNGYRLPTEAEWEFACRAGTTTRFWTGDRDEDLARAGWFGRTSNARSHAVGELSANPFGLYDVHGNAWEWVQDCWEPTYYGELAGKPAVNPTGPSADNGLRVFRGGNLNAFAPHASAADRHANAATWRDYLIGFRVALTVDAVKEAINGRRPGNGGGAAIAPLTEAELKRVAALPHAEQVEAVKKELKRRNPDFDGTLTPDVEDGVVTGLVLSTNGVTDISPVRALTGLKVLICCGTERRGKLTDLSPLRGLGLTTLDCNNTQVADLAPLRGMPLRNLGIHHTDVADLSPLTEAPLERLNCSHTNVADFAPLRGMKLLSIFMDGAKVADISPLKGMPLKDLNFREFEVRPERDGPILRSLGQLESINGGPAEEFLKTLEAR
jgi:formylglycine-generating enzyme required for sulfatase activity